MIDLKQRALELVEIDKLDFDFQKPPLLISGVAMMYYGLRESDKDVDMILHQQDHINLAKSVGNINNLLHEDHKPGYKEDPQFTEIYGDNGILIYQFELWDSINGFTYEELSDDSFQEEGFNVISLERLMFLSTMRGIHKERYLNDAKLIASFIEKQKYRNFKLSKNAYWLNILAASS